MTDNEPHKARVLLAQIRPALPLLAAAFVLLALWLIWSGWRQAQDASRRGALETNRDTVVQLTQRTVQGELDRLAERLASEPVQAALAAGDLAAAGAALGRDWTHLEEAVVLPADLTEAYSGLEQGGYGRVAVAEAALSEGKPVMWVVRDGDAARVALAAPARVGDAVAGVAFVRLPLSRATLGLENVTVADDTYVALRQGGFNLLERGNPEFAVAAERMAVPVPGTGLRVAAAVPARTINPFGLDPVPSFVVGALLLLLAYLLWRLPRRIRDPRVVDHGTAPTFEQALVEAPREAAEAAGARRIEVQDAPKPAPVSIDRGIFRAYDIRGIVGQTLDVGVAELIGHAIGSLMHEKGLNDIVVGRDGRLSGPDMVHGLVAGLRKAGRQVIDVGMVPTPVVYFGAYHLRTGCCVSVTGSHNPPDYNGFKIVVEGETLAGDAIQALYERIAENRLHAAPAPGIVNKRDITEDYIERIAGDIQIERKLKVVVDCGNGIAGAIAPRLLSEIGADVEPL